MSTRARELDQQLRPVVAALGYELWGIEWSGQGRHSKLRLFIDGPEGITVDDCATVSEQVSSLLDVEEPITGAYTLEVSSPGIDRPLFTLEQCRRFAGCRVQLRLRRPFDGRRKYEGLLVGVEDEDIVVRVSEDEEVLLPFPDVERMNLIGEIG